MRIVVLVVFISAVSLLTGGCARDGGEGAGGKGAERKVPRASDSPREGVVAAMKEKKLAAYKTSTIGYAFDNYRFFEKREWKETISANGKIYIDFWGWFNTGKLDDVSIKNGITARGIAVKFVINQPGAFYLAMISKIEATADGKMYAYPLEDKKSIMDAIYANKEITF